MRWAKCHITILAILERKQNRTVALSTSRTAVGRPLVPNVFRLNNRHRHFLSARTIHLFADDPLHLMQNAQAQWQVAIHTGGQLTNKASTHKQLLVDTLSISWCLTQRFCE